VLEGAVTNRLHARLTGSYQVSARLGNCVLFSESYAFITLDDLIRELESNRIKVYPNPGLADREHPAFVEFYARASDEVELTVIAMQGKIVHRERPPVQDGKNTVSLVLDYLPPGIYGLHVLINGESFGNKLIIHR